MSLTRTFYDIFPNASRPGSEYQGGSGINPHLDQLSTNYFNIPDPVRSASAADRALGTQLYNQDSGQYGLLASYYGPLARAAASIPLRDLYPASSFRSFGPSDAFGGGSINVALDWDLANKQAEPGTVHYFRKIAADSRVVAPEVDAYVRGYFDSKYGTLAQSTAVQTVTPPAYKLADRTLEGNSDWAYSYQTKVTSSPVSYAGWNKPNQNLFNQSIYGGGGALPFRHDERLAPTSVSQGTGLFSGPSYSIRSSGKFSLVPSTSSKSYIDQQLISKYWG